MNPEQFLNPEQKLSRVEFIVQQNPEVAGLQAYEYFRSDVATQKTGFIAGETELFPKYTELTEANIRAIAEPAKVALETLFKGDENPKTQALYDSIEYRFTELFMLDQARIMNDHVASLEEKSEAQKMFVHANEALYGKPDKEIFTALANKHIVTKLSNLPDEFVESKKLQDELRMQLDEIRPTDFQPFCPSEKLVQRIGSLVHERFDALVEHIEDEHTYDVAGIALALDAMLEKIGGKELGWLTRVVPNSSAMAVSAHQKQVEVGERRAQIQGSDLKPKAIHEVGVHAQRSINALKAGWLSAAYGQEGYLDFEESLAVALEDAYKGVFADHGENYYLIAGLAYGLDNHAPRNFREVFEVMWRMAALKVTDQSNDVTAEQIHKAQNTSFTACVRFFRGTEMHTPGIVYLKDLAYFKGQELAWSVLKDIHTQEDFDLLFTGKLDLTQASHKEIAQSIARTRQRNQ